MAISFARLTIHSRSKGHSAVAAAAYRAGALLYDERTGETHDYTNRHDVAHSELILPQSSHAKFMDREFLWNQVEAAERRKDAQLAKELTLALPKELSIDQQIELAKQFAQENFVTHGLAVDLAIHDKADGNPHAHLLVTTRRLEYHHFSLKKARDLNPVFYGRDQKKVFDFWNDKWRDCQNTFFQAHGIDLRVDADYLIPTKHQGRVRQSGDSHYVQDENLLRQQASYEALLDNPELTLEHLSSKYATFTEKDIAIFVFKNTQTTADFERVYEQAKASKQLLFLGHGEDGRALFTTRHSYEREQKLINQALSMSGRKDKAISTKLVRQVSEQFGLQQEQKEAIEYLVQQGDIACLVGRAGAGKTYAMKAIHSLYSQKGYSVYGTALSGVAAKALEAETGIKSDTIHSLSYRIEKGRYQPKPGSVIVVDEAGMVSLRDMSRLLDFAKQSRCKLILLGDPDQLQPIMAGAPFRALLDHVGFVEMQNIQRQRDSLDREASVHLAAGKVGLAIDHYAKQEQLELLAADQVQQALILAWQESLSGGLDNQVILAHTRRQVTELNQRARQVMLEQQYIAKDSTLIRAADGEIALARGDRIVFLRNNKALDIYNGNFGTVKAIDGTHITVQVGERVVSFDTNDYHDFSYGYAATVHKSQGATFDQAFVLLDGRGWDRHLSYVAMTRHKSKLNVFVNQDTYRDLDQLKRQLSRSPIRDNAIDYPLTFAERRGFDPDTAFGQALNHVAGAVNRVKDGWLYLTNYEKWIIHHSRQLQNKQAQIVRLEARKVAEFADLNQAAGRAWSKLYRQNAKDLSQLPGYSEAVSLSAERNRLAYEVYVHHAGQRKALIANGIELKKLEQYANEHLRHEQVRAFKQTPSELVRGKLAQDIVADRQAYHKAVQALQVDWQNIHLANWAIGHRQTLIQTGQKEAYDKVSQYAVLRKEAAKAWSRANAEFKAPGDNPNAERNLLRAKGLTAQLDQVAYDIYHQKQTYQEAMDFYKVDEQSLMRCHNRHLSRQGQFEQVIPTKTSSTDKITVHQRWHTDNIHQALLSQPEETYRAIFGEPKQQTSKEMRYPGGLIVTTKGSHSGEWYSFTSAVGGSPIQAIQYQMGLSYVEALEYGAKIAGLSDIEAKYDDITESIKQRVKDNQRIRVKQTKREATERIDKAQQIWSHAEPLSNTLAETYLRQHRGITEGFDRLQFKYLAGYKDIPPALVLPAYNAEHELTGIQRVFLSTKTGNKNLSQANAKISTGVIKGSAGIVQQAPIGHRVYLAEGPETAASIAMADPDATVLTSFSVSNLGNLAALVKRYNPYEVIIAADNDGQRAQSDAAFNKAIAALEEADLSVIVKKPDLLPQQAKSDWNDILKEKGVAYVRRSLGLDTIKAEWNALKELNHTDINALLRIDADLKKPQNAEQLRTLNLSRNKIICQLLRGTDNQLVPKLAPNVMRSFRQELFSKNLSPLQRELLEHKDWSNLTQGQGRQFVENVALLNNIKKQIFDNLYDKPKVHRLMKPIASLLDKMMLSKQQSAELQRIAPKLYSALQSQIKHLNQVFNRDRALERERD